MYRIIGLNKEIYKTGRFPTLYIQTRVSKFAVTFETEYSNMKIRVNYESSPSFSVNLIWNMYTLVCFQVLFVQSFPNPVSVGETLK